MSSVIRGFEELREAACAAIDSLGHVVIRAEDFEASPKTAQIACLTGVREADAVVLLLGDRYGEQQASGISPTHEEYNEAKDTKPLFCFIQSSVLPDATQADFIAEVQEWTSGSHTVRFSTVHELSKAVTTAIHRWELENAAGKVDSDEMVGRALEQLPDCNNQSRSSPVLALSIVGGPAQSVLRPSQLDDDSFQESLIKRALFDSTKIFESTQGTERHVAGHKLSLEQDAASLTVSEDGSILIATQSITSGDTLAAIIEENVTQKLIDALEFGSGLLDLFDPTERLSHVVPAISLTNADHAGWKTLKEQERNPNTMRMGRIFDNAPIQIVLSPPHRPRATLRQNRRELAQDLTVLLKRKFQD